MMEDPNAILTALARLYGLHTSYQDVSGQTHRAEPRVIFEVLRSLGAPLEKWGDLKDALVRGQRERARRGLDPTIVLWGGRGEIKLSLSAGPTVNSIHGILTLETGDRKELRLKVSRRKKNQTFFVGRRPWARHHYYIKGPIPFGYHRLDLFHGKKRWSSWLFSAPPTAFQPPGRKTWGFFVPLYGLRTRNTWGSGSFSDFASLQRWTFDHGGGVLATLPLLPVFLDTPLDPSPYAPVSRLFWNEFFIDPGTIAELGDFPSVQKLIASETFKKQIRRLNQKKLVDYRGIMALKGKVLKKLAEEFFRKRPQGDSSFKKFISEKPLVKKYAAFRAIREKLSLNWKEWPARLKEGKISPRDYAGDVYQYFLYSQWQAHRQVEALNHSLEGGKARLYLDLPLGVHPEGFDVWNRPELFVQNATGGAPPDAVFTKGQNWGFPPLHPEVDRLQGYPYLRSCLRHHLFSGGILRIDHVMSLHRLFYIPRGRVASEGLYVSYPFEDFYAMLCVESQRSRALVAGEDLGTVPPEVPRTMSRRGIHRLYVVQYELESERPQILPRPSSRMIASINTHDMPPLAGYWKGTDLKARRRSGLLSTKLFLEEKRRREKLKSKMVGFLKKGGYLPGRGGLPAVFAALVRFLSSCNAKVVLFNLEDFWLETQFQNMPGTGPEFHNWRRKIKKSYENFCQDPGILGKIQIANQFRKKKR